MIDKKRIEAAIKEILLAIGENPDREGLKETPKRVAQMYEEIFSGINADISSEIKIFRKEYYQSVVVVKDIPLFSMCEHHLIPFFGKADVAYVPSEGNILGLSKIARIVDLVSKKPQLQERLCYEAADIIMQTAKAQGALVIVEAEHLCMSMRGIKKVGAKTLTMAASGCLKTDQSLKTDALRLLGR